MWWKFVDITLVFGKLSLTPKRLQIFFTYVFSCFFLLFMLIVASIQGMQPQKTVFTVSRARKGYTALSGWNFTIPDERKTVIYALQTLIDYFNVYE
jgi:hypothetical protein